MKKFVVSHIDWFDYELKSWIIEAENELDALKKIVIQEGFFSESDIKDISCVEDFKTFCFNWDSMMHAIEI